MQSYQLLDAVDTQICIGALCDSARYCIDVKIYRWSCSIKIHNLKKDKHGMVWSTTDLGLQNASMVSFVYSKTNYPIKHQNVYFTIFIIKKSDKQLLSAGQHNLCSTSIGIEQ